jgi:hypothetical protein
MPTRFISALALSLFTVATSSPAAEPTLADALKVIQ